MSFCLLLKLKHWLKTVYSLSDERCQEFRPSEGNPPTHPPTHPPNYLYK